MGEPTPLRAPRVRRAAIPDEAMLVVRGDDLDARSRAAQALAFRRRFPDWDRFGLSAYYARNRAEVDDLAADQLERFPILAIFRRADLDAAGFEVVPTFRTPHVTVAFKGDLDERIAVFASLAFERLDNPYHEPEPGELPGR